MDFLTDVAILAFLCMIGGGRGGAMQSAFPAPSAVRDAGGSVEGVGIEGVCNSRTYA